MRRHAKNRKDHARREKTLVTYRIRKNSLLRVCRGMRHKSNKVRKKKLLESSKE